MMPPYPPLFNCFSFRTLTLSEDDVPPKDLTAAEIFFVNESGVRCDGGVLIRSRTKCVYCAITCARFKACLASTFLENLEWIAIVASGNLRSDFVDPRNSSKA